MDVSVRSPFPVEALPRVWGWISRFRHKVADDFSPQSLDEFVAWMIQQYDTQPGQVERPRKTWAIYGNGELGGLITYEQINQWVGTAHLLLKPDFQGRGMAAPALRAAFSEIFKLGIGRLVFYVLAKNLAVGSLIVNLGGRREGCLRGQTLQGGKPTDVWIYGLLKAEFEGKLNELSVRVDEDHQQQHDADADLSRLGSVQPAE